MLHLETPHVNVLSKVDLMDKYGDLDFNLEYYADVQDLHYLADRMLGENDEPEGGASSTRVNEKRRRARGCCARSTKAHARAVRAGGGLRPRELPRR